VRFALENAALAADVDERASRVAMEIEDGMAQVALIIGQMAAVLFRRRDQR
jgi:hypothetical protein